MGTLSLIGGWLCDASLGLQLWFVIWLLIIGQRKKNPAFFWFMVFDLAERSILFVLFLADKSISRHAYADVFWRLRLLEIVGLAWVVGQLWRKEWLVLFGIAVAAAQIVHFHLWADRWYGFLICAAVLVFLAACKPEPEQRAIALGLFLLNLFPAIVEVPQLFHPGTVHDVLRYVPNVSMLLAQIVWLRAFWLPSLKTA